MNSLRERALLAVLHRSNWSGVVRDKDATDVVLTSNGAESGAAAVMKRVMSRRNMKAINSHLTAAKDTHERMTSPWGNQARILSSKAYMEYTQKMRLHRLGVEAARDAFMAEYDDAVQSQRARLGSLFRMEDYPPPEEIKGKFSMDVEIMPLPETRDFRIDLGDAAVKSLIKDVERRTEERIEAAVQDTFKRVADVTKTMAERLKGDGTFRDTLLSNVLELADLLPSLNITDDKRLDELATKMKDDLGVHGPEVLRTDPAIRRQVASKADAIFARVASYM